MVIDAYAKNERHEGENSRSREVWDLCCSIEFGPSARAPLRGAMTMARAFRGFSLADSLNPRLLTASPPGWRRGLERSGRVGDAVTA